MLDVAEIAAIPPNSLSSIPALIPPNGQQSKFVNPVDKGPAFVDAATVLFCLVLVVFTIRLYTKVAIARRLSWDDLSLTIGFLLTTVFYGAFVAAAGPGPYGKHQWNVSIAEVMQHNVTITGFISTTVVNMALGFIKLSFFLLYFQLFWPVRWLRIAIYIGAPINCAIHIAATVAEIYFMARRPGQSWFEHDLTMDAYKATKLAVPLSVVGLAIDLFLFVLPIQMVMQLQMAPMKRFGVILLFGTGGLACIASILSIYFRVVASHSQDTTWHELFVLFFALVEMYVGIVVNCVPSLAMMFRHHKPFLSKAYSHFRTRLGWSRLEKQESQDALAGNLHLRNLDNESPSKASV